MIYSSALILIGNRPEGLILGGGGTEANKVTSSE
jgi:hypothetical protein